MAKIIVFGNEKGGSGKSTTAIHVAIALCYQNKNVGIILCGGNIDSKIISSILMETELYITKNVNKSF